MRDVPFGVLMMLESTACEELILVSREIIFVVFQSAVIVPQRHRRTDKQMNGQTTCRGITALGEASRGKN